MTNQTVLDVLTRAMFNEQDGYNFYVAAAQRTNDPKGKAMFQSLANDETEHLTILQNEYQLVSEGKAFADLATARQKLPARPDLQLFPEKGILQDLLKQATGDDAILKIALDFELKGYQMYDAAGKSASDKNAAAIFAYMAKMEDWHYELIQKSINYLADKGIWFFDEIERPLFEG